MRLTEVIDNSASSAGYKFDLFDSQASRVVKAFATRDAVCKAVATGQRDYCPFDLILIEAANKKFERGELEEDGLILINSADVRG